MSLRDPGLGIWCRCSQLHDKVGKISQRTREGMMSLVLVKISPYPEHLNHFQPMSWKIPRQTQISHTITSTNLETKAFEQFDIFDDLCEVQK